MTDRRRPAKRPKLLIVDDDPQVIDRLRQLLEDDVDVAATDDWVELNKEFFRGGLDLILMDVKLPTISGDRLVQILKRTVPGAGKPKIVFFSAEDEAKLAALVASTGADGFLSKSVRGPALLEAIQGLLGND
jgi:CheY-like chemotaxis protein